MCRADALGAPDKPIMRVRTAGSVGGSTAIVASHLVHARQHRRVLAVAFEKRSEGNAAGGLGGGKSGSLGAGGIFAPWIRAYISRSGAPEHIGWQVAVKDRLNALKNPYSHLRLPDITIEKVRDSPMLWDPLHWLESCPSSHGACAVVLTDQARGRDAPAPGNTPAWVAATAMRSEPGGFPGRDPIRPRAGGDCSAHVYRQAGITHPPADIDDGSLFPPFRMPQPMSIARSDQSRPRAGLLLVSRGR